MMTDRSGEGVKTTSDAKCSQRFDGHNNGRHQLVVDRSIAVHTTAASAATPATDDAFAAAGAAAAATAARALDADAVIGRFTTNIRD